MASVVSSRSRKADGPLKSEPATKKQRLTSSKSRDQPRKSLKDALFANGAPKKLEAKQAAPSQLKSSHAVQDAKSTISTTVGQKPITKQIEVVEISSDSSSSDDDDEDEEEEEQLAEVAATNGAEEEAAPLDDEEDESNEVPNDSDKENAMDTDDNAADERTFGELLQSAPIDVQAAFDNADDDAALAPLAPHLSSRQLVLSSTTSLATVLTQALKTNDRDLIESCFMTTDYESVRSTIARLPSHHVEALLHHIADKMYKRPGRAGSLLIWIQWSLVSHGGYLARKKDLVNKIGALQRVMNERAKALEPLLNLKGKLDLLAAQMAMRREMMDANRKDQEEDEDVVIYVEGQENLIVQGKAPNESDDEDDDEPDLDDSFMTGALNDEDDEEDGSEDDDEEE
jgi:U3 small nucleolar RNA-associated protein 5